MAKNTVPPRAANDNDRDTRAISFAQLQHLTSLPTYLRGGRI